MEEARILRRRPPVANRKMCAEPRNDHSLADEQRCDVSSTSSRSTSQRNGLTSQREPWSAAARGFKAADTKSFVYGQNRQRAEASLKMVVSSGPGKHKSKAYSTSVAIQSDAAKYRTKYRELKKKCKEIEVVSRGERHSP